MMMNLLAETIERLGQQGKQTADVRWVGNQHGFAAWDRFEIDADFDYNAGFGGTNVLTSLVVVGENWWLERHEYDGSEWWEFKTIPVKPAMHCAVLRLHDRTGYEYVLDSAICREVNDED